MKVTDPNIIVGSSGLLSVEDNETHDKVKITLKNKTTLEISVDVDEDGKFLGLSYDYLTAQQNKKINSLKEKMAKLQNEMKDIISAENSEDAEEPEDIEDIFDEEIE